MGAGGGTGRAQGQNPPLFGVRRTGERHTELRPLVLRLAGVDHMWENTLLRHKVLVILGGPHPP